MTHERIVTRAHRRVASSLEPGEREDAVLRGWVGLDRRLFVILAVGAIVVVALWAFPRSSAPASVNVDAWYGHEIHQLILRWAAYAAIVLVESFAIACWSPTRWFVLTDRRLLIFDATFSGASPRTLLSAERLGSLGVEEPRPRFPVQGGFGLRRSDEDILQVGFLRSWRPCVDRIATALAASSPPPRPDVAAT